ncbi:MAG: RDD family protein [Alphaproteobacteria bacterium]|nr:MAG: RDD family protein [Alphaproteobacteria bacterium]
MSAAAKNRRPARIRKIREIATPEGVSLKVELADRGDRAGALIIDLVILLLGMIGAVVAIFFITGSVGLDRLGLIIVLLSMFLFRNFYFMFFELRWQGQTPGKRKLGIKVIDRFGQPLTSEAIFARNMMREVEIFIPLGIVFSGGATGVSGLMQLFSFIWAGALVCLPFFNRDNLRAGDLIAGTLVVRQPATGLARDMLESGEKLQASGDGQYSFTTEQLRVYGIYELQMLEELLRNVSPEGGMKRLTAGKAIVRKIKWPDPVHEGQMDAFLQAYYHALRKHLEGGLLMGKRKENKFDGPPPVA